VKMISAADAAAGSADEDEGEGEGEEYVRTFIEGDEQVGGGGGDTFDSRRSSVKSNASVRSVGSNSSFRSRKSSSGGGGGRRDSEDSIGLGEMSMEDLDMVMLGVAQMKRRLQLEEASKKGGGEEDEVDQGGGAGEGSMSAFIEQDLIALLRHLEYSEGREKMSRRAKREHRTSRVSSSEHFKFPDDDHEKTY